MRPPSPAARLVVQAWLALAAVTTLPYLIAWRWPPAGLRFTGAFFYVDDYYQYLSFVEQAGRGRLVFENKFDTRPHAPLLVNVEWIAAGLLGAAAGGPVVGWRLLWLAALGGMVGGFVRCLRIMGLDGRRLIWALALVCLGTGLGWLRFWMGQQGARIPDLRWGVYPWQEAIANAHFVTGTMLLLWTLVFYVEWQHGSGRRWRWIACASALGLARPFDLGTFLLVAAVLAAADAVNRPRAALERAASFVWLLPVLAYDALVFGLYPAFAVWSGRQNVIPPTPLPEFLWALGPAAALAVAFRRRSTPATPLDAPLRRALAAWVGCVIAMLVLTSVVLPSFVQQQLPGVGAALLLLAGATIPERWAPWTTLALLPTSLLIWWSVSNPGARGFAPAEYFDAVRHLESSCRPGQVAVAPEELSLMIAGLTACRVHAGHRVLTPDVEQRRAETARFYDAATPAAWRRAFLASTHAAFVALPAGRRDWLGPDPPYAPAFAQGGLEIWQPRPPWPVVDR